MEQDDDRLEYNYHNKVIILIGVVLDYLMIDRQVVDRDYPYSFINGVCRMPDRGTCRLYWTTEDKKGKPGEKYPIKPNKPLYEVRGNEIIQEIWHGTNLSNTSE